VDTCIRGLSVFNPFADDPRLKTDDGRIWISAKAEDYPMLSNVLIGQNIIR